MGGDPEWWLTAPPDWNMRVPDAIRDSVAFLSTTVAKGKRLTKAYGTGFFVSVPGDPPGTAWSYLVTARHVADDCIGRKFAIHLNRHDGTAAAFQHGPAARWYPHPDKTVDVAVLPLTPDPAEIRYARIGTKIFATETRIKAQGIGPGDEVFIAGLFAEVLETTKNIPIVRTGNVAMMPGERIPILLRDPRTRKNRRVKADVYLIEARSIGGISGSPVFVRETISQAAPPRVSGFKMSTLHDPNTRLPTFETHTTGNYFLLGLVQGHWDIPPELKNDLADMAPDARDAVNLGIAIVVPATKILEVLDLPELTEERRRGDEERRRSMAVTLDGNKGDQEKP